MTHLVACLSYIDGMIERSHCGYYFNKNNFNEIITIINYESKLTSHICRKFNPTTSIIFISIKLKWVSIHWQLLHALMILLRESQARSQPCIAELELMFDPSSSSKQVRTSLAELAWARPWLTIVLTGFIYTLTKQPMFFFSFADNYACRATQAIDKFEIRELWPTSD